MRNKRRTGGQSISLKKEQEETKSHNNKKCNKAISILCGRTSVMYRKLLLIYIYFFLRKKKKRNRPDSKENRR